MIQIPAHIFNNNITEAKQQFTYAYLGNVSYQESYNLEDILNDMMSADPADIKYREAMDMYEIHRVQKYSWCPQYLTELLSACQDTFTRNANVICFAADNIDVGYGWHGDLFDIIATNVVGETTWFFENGDEVHMKPFDLLYVPKGLRHTVRGHTPRFTAAIGNNRVTDV